MDSNARLRLATRLHFAVLRHLGDSVDVDDILHRPAQTRELLWVCEASGDDELMALAAQFRDMMAAPAPRDEAPAVDEAWARDSSGFGPSRPPGLPDRLSPKPGREWFRPSTWLR
jgi:hypothetical protein